MKRTVLYLDTEEARIERVLDIVTATLEHSDIIHVKSVNEAYRVLLERTIDIFIINITLKSSLVTDLDGLHLVSCIREIPKYILAPVIILSSLQDPQLYMYEELNCMGYLSKTFPSDKLVGLLQKASQFKTKSIPDKALVFRKKRALYPVLIKNIVYMVRENGITSVHLVNGEVLDFPYVSYSQLLYKAGDNGLFMCNRSTVVNKDYVYAVDLTNCFVVLRDKWGMLDIGLKYRAGVKAEFSGSYKISSGRKKQTKWDE